MTISFEIKGREQMQRAFRMLGEKGPTAMGAALWREGNRIMTDAKAITPVDTGVLKQSGHVTMPTISGNSVSVTLGFGGAASAYAEIQHEELSFKHKPPTQAKFLEGPLLKAAQTMGQRIAQDLQKELK